MTMSKKAEDKQEIKVEDYEKLQKEFEDLKALTTQLDGQLKRAVADYRNLETRVKEGRSELTTWGTIELTKKLLTVLDYLEQATMGVSEAERGSGWFRGVELAIKQFKEVLKSEGLDEILADGVFDPSLHEALDTQEGEDNKILKLIRRGYKLSGKVLRPAGVVVGRSETGNQKQEAREEEKNEMSN